jgi:hypothetical protein
MPRRGADVYLYSSFNLNARWWVVNTTLRPLYPQETRYPLYRRLGGPHD